MPAVGRASLRAKHPSGKMETFQVRSRTVVRGQYSSPAPRRDLTVNSYNSRITWGKKQVGDRRSALTGPKRGGLKRPSFYVRALISLKYHFSTRSQGGWEIIGTGGQLQGFVAERSLFFRAGSLAQRPGVAPAPERLNAANSLINNVFEFKNSWAIVKIKRKKLKLRSIIL